MIPPEPVSVKDTRINRNIVECKLHNLRLAYLTERTVLIETLWNVNKIPAEIFRIPPAIVLIETLWNVNQVSGETYYEEY